MGRNNQQGQPAEIVRVFTDEYGVTYHLDPYGNPDFNRPLSSHLPYPQPGYEPSARKPARQTLAATAIMAASLVAGPSYYHIFTDVNPLEQPGVVIQDMSSALSTAYGIVEKVI